VTPRVMVLVATYLEAQNICRLLDELCRPLPEAEILVIDDQSRDGTADLVQQRYAHDPRVRPVSRSARLRGVDARGYGAVSRLRRRSLDHHRCDLSHDPALTVRMLENVAPGGVAIGSRYIDGVRALAADAGVLGVPHRRRTKSSS